jgi:hypothetical protein
MVGLFGSTVLEAVVGVASVYLILAVFCSAVNEWIAHALDARAKNLKTAMGSIFQNQHLREGTDFLAAFYRHPVINGLAQQADHVSYLPPRAFSTAVIDLATSHIEGSVAFKDLETGISNLPPGPVRQTLLALIQDAAGDFTRAQINIEHWFDDNMERASGWYRRRAQLWNLGLAVFVTIATNADTLHLLQRFWSEPALRAAPPSTLLQLGPVIGWSAETLHPGTLGWLSRLVGWLLTILAVSLGAPFWFDILNRAVNLRNAARPPAVTPARSPVFSTRPERHLQLGCDGSSSGERPHSQPLRARKLHS